MEGFWLPQDLRRRLLSAETPMASATMRNGAPASPQAAGSVTAHWPQFDHDQWRALLAALRENRRRLPAGPALWDRLQAALARAGARLADPNDPCHQQAVATLPAYTGYSEAMIRFALRAMGLMALDQLPQALELAPDGRGITNWQPLGGMPGRWRFYPESRWRQALGRLSALSGRSLFGPIDAPELVVGYGAGNVPGAALLITFLGLAAGLVGEYPPAIVVKNSRQEPIFAPLVLNALEAEDPELVSAAAVLIWDYEDADLQRLLLGQADLVMAAASDETIAQIRRGLAAARPERPARFHAHGHKVSFSLIGREVLTRGGAINAGQPLLDAVASLAALDSAFWDQNGCLSSRIHFVEAGTKASHTAEEYAAALAAQLRLLALALPRGAWPQHQLHDRFDRYKVLEAAGQAQVLSGYDDQFVVVVDRRPLVRTASGAAAFHSTVNDCQGRVIIVRAVPDLMEVPECYLALLPPANLQSFSVAVGRAGEGLTARFLAFAEACGRRGVTAIRTAGRGAFPQLAYSWDGLMPPDLVRSRPAGHFTTIEFDAPYEQMLATYQTLTSQ